MKKIHALIAMGASLVLAPFFSAHAVTVVDSASTQQVAQESATRANNAANAELFNQVQMLQDEVMRTHGQLEELQFQLQQLKQQRLDDYKNLDKRISELGRSPAAAPVGGAASTVPAPSSVDMPLPNPDDNVVPSPARNDVQATAASAINPNKQDSLDYQKSYDLIKQRKFDQARDAFIDFIAKYPGSEYEPNAHYWLGELYIIEGNYVKAKAEFQVILKNYPTHPKHPEALYKIATVNYELGDRTTAKLQMQQLIDQYGSKPNNAVTKAREFLQTNFP